PEAGDGCRKRHSRASRAGGVPNLYAAQWPAGRAERGGGMSYFAHSTAVVEQPVEIDDGTRIWHFAHIFSGARIGNDCSVSHDAKVGGGVVMVDTVKVPHNVGIYGGTIIEVDVFLGPSCVLPNVTNPRSQVVRHSLYERTLVRRGATIGANATIL